MASNRYEPFDIYPSETVKAYRAVLESDWKLAKPLLNLARYGRFPTNPTSSLAKRSMDAIYALVRQVFGTSSDIGSMRYDEIRLKLNSRLDDFEHPITRGAAVQMCELVRIPKEDEEKLRKEALWKEVSVFRRVVWDRPLLCWDAMTEGGNMVPEEEMTEWAATDIAFSLDQAKRRISRTTLYPSISKKLLPKRARDWFRERPHQVFEDPDIATPAELEKFYITFGVHMDGPSEIKQRWYMHGLVPRTYATAGETAFTYSKYLKDVWNILWNAFPPTQKFNRVDISRIRRKSAKYSFAMYDLSTFTSNLRTHRDFVLSLSRKVDIEVEVMDGRRGLRTLSLRFLLEEYATYLCQSVTWYTDMGEFKGMPEDVHAVAGLLGIIGNIASCGLAHGIFLRTLVGELEEEGVAGDDAIFVYLIKMGWRRTTDIIRDYLGDLADDKVYDLMEGDAVYLKRGVIQDDDGTLSLNDYVFFPKTLYQAKSDTERFRESRDVDFNPYLFERMFVSSLGSTYRSAGRISCDYTVLKTFLEFHYRNLSLPISGHCPGIAGTHFVPVWAEDLFVPAIDRIGDSDYVRNQYLDSFEGEGRFAESELPYDPVVFELSPGMVFQAKMDKHLSYLDRLGVFERRKVMVEVSGTVAIRRLEDLVCEKRIRPVYEFRVKEDSVLPFCHNDVLLVRGCPIGTVCCSYRTEWLLLTSGIQSEHQWHDYGMTSLREDDGFSMSSADSMEEGEIVDPW